MAKNDDREFFTGAGYYIKQHVNECYDEDGEFDWEEYQRLCDEAAWFEDD